MRTCVYIFIPIKYLITNLSCKHRCYFTTLQLSIILLSRPVITYSNVADIIFCYHVDPLRLVGCDVMINGSVITTLPTRYMGRGGGGVQSNTLELLGTGH